MAHAVRPRRRTRPAATTRDVVIDSLGARGDGVVRSGEIFIPLTLPGERVRARIAAERGELEEVLEASADRAAPSCRHFGECGGCALQHATRAFYLDWKRERVIGALRRAGFDDPPVAPVIAIEPATRRRSTFSVRRSGEGVGLGFKARASHRLVAIEACDILHPHLFAGFEGLKAIAGALPADWRSFDLAATLCENGLDIDLTSPKGLRSPEGPSLAALGALMNAQGVLRLSVNGEPLLTFAPPIVRFAGVAVSPPPGGFLQASAEGESALAALVERAAKGGRRALDLFCGAGALSFPLSRTATVHAVDADEAAVAALKAGARQSPHRPVTAERRNLFERPFQPEELSDFDAVVFDPPRAGAREQAAAIARSTVKSVVAVSCNPQTFARDAALLAAGGYRLLEVTPVDQFVYSPHIELVGAFTKGR